MNALFRYPGFALLHLGSVLVALVIYRACYVDVESVSAFFSTWNPAQLSGFTIDDFWTPLMLCLAFSALHGFVNYCRAFRSTFPHRREVLKLWLCLLVHVDYVFIGGSLAVSAILDSILDAWTQLSEALKVLVLFVFWEIALRVARSYVRDDLRTPVRGSWVWTLDYALLRR